MRIHRTGLQWLTLMLIIRNWREEKWICDGFQPPTARQPPAAFVNPFGNVRCISRASSCCSSPNPLDPWPLSPDNNTRARTKKKKKKEKKRKKMIIIIKKRVEGGQDKSLKIDNSFKPKSRVFVPLLEKINKSTNLSFYLSNNSH